MAEFVFAYFSVIGVQNHDYKYKLLPSATVNTLVPPSEVWLDAITDLTVIFFDKEDSVPNLESDQPIIVAMNGVAWELIRYTVDGHSGNCNQGDDSRGIAYLGIQRRRSSGRIDHICDVDVVHKNDPIPQGYEIIEKMITAEKFAEANPNSVSRLIVKRASINAFLYGSPIIDDICLVNLTREESAPSNFKTTTKCLNPKPSLSDTILISFHCRDPLGLCDLQYESSTINRYPDQNIGSIELPVNDLPTFVFPQSLQFFCDTLAHSFPLPDFSPLVFTDIKGDYLYTMCLKFFEPVPKDIISELFFGVFGQHIDHLLPDCPQVYCPKIICVSSHYPFYRAMRMYLKQIYSLSLSPLQIPLESFITSVVSRIPLPLPGGRCYHVILDVDLIPPTSQPMPPIIFDSPSQYSSPFNEAQFSSILKYLSVDNILAIFYLLLCESKLIFVSHSSTLLTDVMESFRMLLFPLQWTSTYITRLPRCLANVLHAPGGYMIGLQNGSSTMQFFEHDLSVFLKTFDPPNHCVVVDIICNKLYGHNQKLEPFVTTKIAHILKSYPSQSYRKLSEKLQGIRDEHQKTISLQYHMNIDSVFDMRLSDNEEMNDSEEGKSDPCSDAEYPQSNLPTVINRSIRDAFLCFMCDLIGDFVPYYLHDSIVHPRDRFNSSSNLADLYNVDAYVKDSDKVIKQLVLIVIESQMFAYFIHQWKEKPTHQQLFFWDCVKYQKVLGLSALPNDKRAPLNSTYPDIVLDAINSADIDSGVLLCDYVEAIYGLSYISLSLQKKLSLSQFMLLKKDLETKIRKEVLSRGSWFEKNLIGKGITIFDLLDQSLGPLILPGPKKTACIEANDISPQSRGSIEAQAQVWPTLYFKTFSVSECHKSSQLGLENLLAITIKIRLQSLRPSFLLLHDPFILQSCVFTPSLIRSTRKVLNIEALAATSLALEIFSLSLMVMSIKVLNCHQRVSGILQNFATLNQLEKLNLLGFLDIETWRSLFVACDALLEGNYRKHFIHILYNLMSYIEGIVPDNYIMEIHARSQSEVDDKVEMPEQKYLDTGFWHQHQGLIWYSMKLNSSREKKIDASPEKPIRSRSNSVPTSLTHSPSSPPVVSPSIWQRFKSRRSLTIEDTTESVSFSDDFVTKMLSLKSNTYQSFLSLPSICPHMQIATFEAIGARERMLTESTIITERNIEDNIFMWKNLNLKTSSKKDRVSLSILAIQSDDNIVVQGNTRRITNIYCCSWAGSDRLGKQKSNPGLRLINLKETLPSNDVFDASFEFYYDSSFPPLFYHLEVYGDLVDPQELQLPQFDSLLCTVILTPDQIPRDGSPVWLTINTLSNSLIGTGSVDILLSGRLHHLFEKFEDLPLTPKEGQNHSPGDSRLSWSQRFSSVFSRKAVLRDSIETRRSITPPPFLPSVESNISDTNRISLPEVIESARFTDSEDESSNRSESTSSRSVCGINDMPIFESMKMDTHNLGDDSIFEEITEFHVNVTLKSNERKEHQFENNFSIVSQEMIVKFNPKEEYWGIYSFTPCLNCGHSYLDEEIFASWCGLLTEPLKPSICHASQLYQIHEIQCNSCKHLIVPMLHIRRYRINEDMELHISWEQDVPYLCPLAVRFLAETYVREYGPILSNADWLKETNDCLYWNHIWYTSRLNLPNGLSYSNDSTESHQDLPHSMFITLGWRESTIKSIILNRFLNNSSYLNLVDIFPGVSDDDCKIAKELMSKVDFSIHTIAELIRKISTLTSILKSLPGKRGRQIYLAYIFLFYLFQPESLHKVPDFPYGLSKGTLYDKAFIETISSAFTANELEKLNTSYSELMIASTSRATQAIRITLGMLV